MRVGIIGAGIAGLTLATRLVGSGHSATLLDKGRGVGGRASTRRGDGIAFDHGAQYFTARDPSFRAFLNDHVPGTDWAPWEGRFATFEGGRLVGEVPGQPRLVGVPGMSALPRALAKGLGVIAGARVAGLEGSPGRWTLVDAEGKGHGPFDWVVATAPPAQSSAILAGHGPVAVEVARVAMRPCFALMLEPSGGVTFPFDGIRCEDPVLGWASNDHSKPGRGGKPALVIQSGHDWALAHLDDDPRAIAGALREAASRAFGVDLSAAESESVHRWLYAKPVEPLGPACLVDERARLASCGDWCLAAKIEGAFRSGDACASALLAS